MTRAAGKSTRNGSRTKTVLTDVGPVEVRVPRDAAGGEPQIVRKRQQCLTGVDDMVLSLSAKGCTHGEIAAHLAEVSKQTISTITDKVMDGVAEWRSGPSTGESHCIHRRHQRQDPRWSGREPADLRRHGGHGRQALRHPRDLGWGRR